LWLQAGPAPKGFPLPVRVIAAQSRSMGLKGEIAKFAQAHSRRMAPRWRAACQKSRNSLSPRPARGSCQSPASPSARSAMRSARAFQPAGAVLPRVSGEAGLTAGRRSANLLGSLVAARRRSGAACPAGPPGPKTALLELRSGQSLPSSACSMLADHQSGACSCRARSSNLRVP